jgi:amidophosphoribosyltransferase
MTLKHPMDAVTDRGDKPREECGVMAVSSPSGEETAQLAFFGLFALQHRGQEAAGMAVSDGQRARIHKDVGLLSQIFTPETLAPLTGYQAIGHTRYSTMGASTARNAQPFLVETMHGPLALAHNGSLVNAAELRLQLLQRGFALTAASDTEVMALMLAAASGRTWEERLERTMPSWKGAYSLVLLGIDCFIAARDPWGFRPLSIGRTPEGGWAAASETCALNTLGCTDITEVENGEIVVVRGKELTRHRTTTAATGPARCAFEFVYFSRPDSEWDGRSVHEVRQKLGEQLAIEWPAEADVVVPVPDSSIPAAIGYARQSGIPFNDGFIKNRYIGRTFIEPTQLLRERRVAMKFNVLPANLAGQRVVIIDDSLVRGTTSAQLIKLVRDAGAKEVHLRITSPRVLHPCHMGVDMGTYDELIAARFDPERLRQHVGADTLAFLSVEGMMSAIGKKDGYCTACFTGKYPVDVSGVSPKETFEFALA